jgi:hypothetical protein
VSRPVTFEIGGSPEIAYGNSPDRRRFQIYTRSRSTVLSASLARRDSMPVSPSGHGRLPRLAILVFVLCRLLSRHAARPRH